MRASVVGSATGWLAPRVWSGESPRGSPTALPRPQILGPGKQENNFQIPALCTLLLPKSIQIFLLIRNFSNRNRKQKYHMNLTEFRLRCGHSRQNMKLFLVLGVMRVIQTSSGWDACQSRMKVTQSSVLILKGHKRCRGFLKELWSPLGITLA